ALTDTAGAVETQYTYEPFGQTSRTGAANSNPFQDTGRENDGTGLYYYRARYYHPVLQRFISEDPAGLQGGGPNLYEFVANNPTNYIDPTGLFGFGVSLSETTEGGAYTHGSGQSGSVGAGVFLNNNTGDVSAGGFYSWGGFSRGPIGSGTDRSYPPQTGC